MEESLINAFKCDIGFTYACNNPHFREV